ncbi:hypothetical protein Hanom_Chr02g00112021 [Helianthus anomalus]
MVQRPETRTGGPCLGLTCIPGEGGYVARFNSIHVRVFVSAQRWSIRFGSDLVNGSVNSQTWSNLVNVRFDWFGSTNCAGQLTILVSRGLMFGSNSQGSQQQSTPGQHEEPVTKLEGSELLYDFI